MHRGLLLHNLPVSFETALLLPECRLQHSICRQDLEYQSKRDLSAAKSAYNIIFGELACALLPICTVPNENLEAFRKLFNLVPPLHDGHRRSYDKVWLLSIRHQQSDRLDGFAHAKQYHQRLRFW
jgi:hypothetical protein